MSKKTLRMALIGAGVVGQPAGGVAGHRREGGAGGGQRGEVVLRPVPDFDLEAQGMDAAHPLDRRQVQEHHLGGDGQREVARVRGGLCHVGTSSGDV